MSMLNISASELLSKLKADNVKVDCCMPSPPYYAKRVYGSSSYYGGSESCEHEWVEIKTLRQNMSGGQTKKQLTNKGSFGVDYSKRYYVSYRCSMCGCWHGELGQEPSVDEYIKHLCDVFDGVYAVLSDNGVLFVNLADTYIDSGKCRKGLYLVPDRFRIEMTNRGWLCRSKLIWHIVNKMPLSLKDRFLDDYEEVIMFVKGPKYKFNQQYENVNGIARIHRSVITTRNGASKNSNTASYPVELIEPLLLAATDENDLVLDIFAGSGQTEKACISLGRRFVGSDLKESE